MNSARKCIAAVLIVIFGISMLSGCSSPITKPFYTKESLMEQCGFDKVYEHETYFADEKCLMLMKSNLVNGKEYYDYMPSTTSKKIDRDDFIDFVEKEFPYSQSA